MTRVRARRAVPPRATPSRGKRGFAALAVTVGLAVGAAVPAPASVTDPTPEGRPASDGWWGRQPAAAALTTVVRVRIVDFAFRPRRIEIAKGTRVRWRNAGTVSHTTTSTTGLWDSGPLAPGETFRRTFRSRGTFRYFCSIHPDMTGKVVVV